MNANIHLQLVLMLQIAVAMKNGIKQMSINYLLSVQIGATGKHPGTFQPAPNSFQMCL